MVLAGARGVVKCPVGGDEGESMMMMIMMMMRLWRMLALTACFWEVKLVAPTTQDIAAIAVLIC